MILLIGINSQFSHSNLAVLYLKCSLDKSQKTSEIVEGTINDDFQLFLHRILSYHASVYCFSCYIWNKRYVLRLARAIKKIKLDSIIIIGGPEVSYNSEMILEENCCVDYVLTGDGESSLPKLVETVINGDQCCIKSVAGLYYRVGGRVFHNRPSEKSDFEACFPYKEASLDSYNNRIIYYESSRGCPYNCSYCLSSVDSRLSYKGIERVKEEVDFFIKNEFKIVKFVDRTFNSQLQRSILIIDHIIKNNISTKFHFELSPDLINDDLVNIIKTAPKNMLQLEIGIQTFNPKALSEIDRKSCSESFLPNLSRMINETNAHIHLDLISGLPYDGYDEFVKSIEKTILLMPDHIQIGFLKLLEGTKIRKDSQVHGYVYDSEPPYTYFMNNYLSVFDRMRLYSIERVVELIYNRHKLKTFLVLITKKHGFKEFTLGFANYLTSLGLFYIPMGYDSFIDCLISFLKEVSLLTKEAIFCIVDDILKDNLRANLGKLVFPLIGEEAFSFWNRENRYVFFNEVVSHKYAYKNSVIIDYRQIDIDVQRLYARVNTPFGSIVESYNIVLEDER